MFRRVERAHRPSSEHLGARRASLTRWGWLAAAGAIVLLATTSAWGSPRAAPAPGHASGTESYRGPTEPPFVADGNATGNRTGSGPGTGIGSGTVTVKSTNWAGNAVWAKGVTFSDVVGSWVQPAVSCPTNAQQDASFWVGIDGFLKGSTTVEQIGTDSDCDKKNKKLKTGGPTYYAWWEMYPAAATLIPDPVTPGDSMTAQVSATGSSFLLTLTDNSRGWSFSTVQSSSGPQDSAEWIAEAPEGCNGCASVKLADFGTVTFSGLVVTATAASSVFNDDLINMTKGKNARAVTIPVSTSSFSVQWEHT
jgi:hypothetical protein